MPRWRFRCWLVVWLFPSTFFFLTSVSQGVWDIGRVVLKLLRGIFGPWNSALSFFLCMFALLPAGTPLGHWHRRQHAFWKCLPWLLVRAQSRVPFHDFRLPSWLSVCTPMLSPLPFKITTALSPLLFQITDLVPVPSVCRGWRCSNNIPICL